MTIRLSQLQYAIPPPKELQIIYDELPKSLLIVRYTVYAIFVDSPKHDLVTIGGETYQIPYHGYQLRVAIQPWQRIVKYELDACKYKRRLTNSLPTGYTILIAT